MNLTNALLVITPYLNATPLPHYPPTLPTVPGLYVRTNIEPARGYDVPEGLVLEGDTLVFHPERRTGLPGTPREGEVLTTEEAVLRPCFAAVDPACPGHLHTNLTRWRWTSGAWDRIWETNGVTAVTTNLLMSDSINWTLSATNVTMKLSEDSRIRKALKELTDALEGRE